MNYNLFIKLFHRLVLGSKNIQRTLFDLEKFFFINRTDKVNVKSLFITGLARSGSTILLNTLYDTGKFASLKYSDMPFVVCPNIWSKINFVKKNYYKKKIRAHNDGVKFSATSPEAFEEVFWKSQINLENKKNISSNYLNYKTIENFKKYLFLVTLKEKKKIYLSKNNNNVEKIDILSDSLENKFILILFRNPINQAFSLLNQHINFTKLQLEDPFVLEYMNLLSHNEFGLNHKPLFDKNFKSNFDKNDINYWLDYWIFIYSRISKFIEKKSDLFFLSYENLKTSPETQLNKINKIIDEKFEFKNSQIFNKHEAEVPNKADKEKLKIANDLYGFIKNYEI